ncbi:methylated-DNA-[protein]-cysteine S-methyltransferase [Actinoplanes lutulentus]|uniref:Methylated-DNA-[protein]-cysteine S-methyltransferase n=1 Tax=Actinoplanes lutulentus TaxID=1287878 RepID=A0A327Z624_9ACTN|nr:methylated-DNA--[protein]-cysteine S-methyltransferase [Actinoplanes lutulentus]MBB2946072.1 methylated-DNA-[protein]-cysteine S-methyltransferase [Actinoplanes lutulentus]RAK32762.1 methylated-DNA-[protein]-cysteine S-methyltransferase [Actinoplanes lutulentus]
MLRHSTLDTPAGPFTVIATDTGAVRAAGFTTDVPELMRLVHPQLKGPVEADDVGPVRDAVRAYLDGDLSALDAIEVQQFTKGGFMGHAWEVMREIKPGAPVTYTQYAELAGRPAAIRGAAQACARNAVALILPCHRVLRTDGSLGGYRWGLPVKSWLLAHESRG